MPGIMNHMGLGLHGVEVLFDDVLGMRQNHMSFVMDVIDLARMHRHPSAMMIIVAIVSVNPGIMIGVSRMHRDPMAMIIVTIMAMNPSIVIQG